MQLGLGVVGVADRLPEVVQAERDAKRITLRIRQGLQLVQHRRAWIRAAVLICVAVAALTPSNLLLVLPWCFLFILGIFTFQFREGTLTWRWYALGVGLAGIGSTITLGVSVALVGVATASVIALVNLRSRTLLFLGEISYSLYLVHVPIGGRIVNLSLRFPVSPMGKVGVSIAAFFASVTVAFLFYRFAERPARSWAARIRSLIVHPTMAREHSSRGP